MKNRTVYARSGTPDVAREKRGILWGTTIAAAALLIAGGAIFVVRMPSWQIQKIAVSGITTLDEREIRESVRGYLVGARAYILPRSSFFLVDIGAIASGLAHDFPRIRAIAVVKKSPDMLDIAITERVLWGVFCRGYAASSTPACAYIDAEGISYERAPEPRGKLIVAIRSDSAGEMTLGTPVIDSVLMGEIRALAGRLPSEAGVAVADFELRARAPSEIRATSAEGFTLIFKREDDYAPILRVLKRVLEGEIKDRRDRVDYLDLRFGNKVFYKLK